jgi:hypothetical protein
VRLSYLHQLRLNLRQPLLISPNPPLQVLSPDLANNGSVFQLVPIDGQLSCKPVALLFESLALSERAGHSAIVRAAPGQRHDTIGVTISRRANAGRAGYSGDVALGCCQTQAGPVRAQTAEGLGIWHVGACASALA